MLGLTASLAIAKTLLTEAAGASGSTVTGGPEPAGDAADLNLDAARFAQALSMASDDGVTAIAATAQAPWHAPLTDVVTRLNRDWDALRHSAVPPFDTPLSPSMLLALQCRTLEVTQQVDLASKVVQKSTQALDQLVRIQ
jgi:hypothetical protein